MNFIKKIFDGKSDEKTHIQFQKFSKGEFKNRALIELKKSEKRWTIKTSAEFANELVEIMAKKLGSEKTKVTGAIVSTNDLTEELDFKDKKQFQGVKRYLMDKEMSGNELIKLLEKFPKTFFALSLEFEDSKLKVKPKAPKSGKSGKGDEKPRADFCNLKTSDDEIADNFVFERAGFKNAEINHTFLIEDIIISNELEKSKDFARIRGEAKRKGRVIRNSIIDGQEIKSEKEFIA